MTKILLVEDDKSLREIYGVRLLAEGYDIVSAGDGEEALAMAIKERPDLIVSDVMMPKISGFDMLDILRSTTETRDIKVIMMTALSSEDQRLRGEKLGADRYLVKSQVGIEDVVRTVHEVLGDLPSMNQQQPQPSVAPMAPQPQPIPTPQMQSPMPQPATPMAAPMPQYQPQPQPIDPAAMQTQPVAPMAPTTQATSNLPQPTAPFSSPAPRPSNLGDRVIQPIQPTDPQSTDLSALIDNELSGASSPMPAPQQQPESQAPTYSTIPPRPMDEQPLAEATQPQQVQAPELHTIAPAPASNDRPDVASLSPQPAAPQPVQQYSPIPQPDQTLPPQPPTQ